MNNFSLVDTNILIYAHDSDSPYHQLSVKIIEEKIEKKEICFSIQNFIEAYRIWTQKLKSPISVKQAWDIFTFYLNYQIPILFPTEKSMQILKKLSLKYRIEGVNIFDTQIVATMIEYGIMTLITANISDFKKYKEIKTINPLEK